jgi:hypothetical protein
MGTLTLGDNVIYVALQHVKEIAANEVRATGDLGIRLTALTLHGAGEGGKWCSVADVLEQALD